jgi:hypothetical protein
MEKLKGLKKEKKRFETPINAIERYETLRNAQKRIKSHKN